MNSLSIVGRFSTLWSDVHYWKFHCTVIPLHLSSSREVGGGRGEGGGGWERGTGEGRGGGVGERDWRRERGRGGREGLEKGEGRE